MIDISKKYDRKLQKKCLQFPIQIHLIYEYFHNSIEKKNKLF